MTKKGVSRLLPSRFADERCPYANATVAILQLKLGYRVSTRDVTEPDGRKHVVISATRD